MEIWMQLVRGPVQAIFGHSLGPAKATRNVHPGTSRSGSHWSRKRQVIDLATLHAALDELAPAWRSDAAKYAGWEDWRPTDATGGSATAIERRRREAMTAADCMLDVLTRQAE